MDLEFLSEKIAENLKSLLEEKGLAETRLALDAGMSRTGVRDIIKRKTKNPSYVNLVKIAEAAGVDVRRIIVGPDFEQSDQDDLETLDLLHQLDHQERQFLLTVARQQIAARRNSGKE